MPTFKHPCPQCGAFINRDVAACPACGRPDPFTPGRCANCKAPIDDPSWVACPKCGQPLAGTVVRGGAAGGPGTAAGPSAAAPTTPVGPAATTRVDPTASMPSASAGAAVGAAPAGAPPAGRCSACGSPLAAGARFCRECGTVVA